MSPMNNRLLVPSQPPGILDFAPGAAAAYSLRNLSRSYAGPVVTVRRSSDDAEDDFTAAEVSDGTLAAFCGAGDGFVYRWWDQSGNANHAVAPADANEAKIVSSGVLVTADGKPAISFDGTDDYFEATSTAVSGAAAVTGFMVWTPSVAFAADTAGGTRYSLGKYDDNNNSIGLTSASGLLSGEKVGFAARTTSFVRLGASVYENDADKTLLEVLAVLPSGVSLYKNAVKATLDLAANGTAGSDYTPATLGMTTTLFLINAERSVADATTTGNAKKIQELILYASDQTTSLDRITGNTMWYY